ncbi:hypothetical protein [Xanthomonas sp. WHRI 8370]|uniref:hypothetical protein n=1 Tax=Xanthomonas sp. WHRI 8370 TaxID=3161572 RepID=UPI0032E90B3A
MDVAAKLNEAQILRVAVIDDDLSSRITHADLQIVDPHVAALLNDPTDPDREEYLALLTREGRVTDEMEDLAEPLAEEAIRAQAPARLRAAAESVLTARRGQAAPVQRVIDLLKELGVGEGHIDTYPSPQIPHDRFYDLMIVDYFLVDATTNATLPFIREVREAHQDQERPLQIILMSSHEEQLKEDFKTIRPGLKVSSSRMRIMEKPATDTHLVAWRAALWQLASDRAEVTKMERFINDAGTALAAAATATASKLWELDLQAMDLLHELASEDNDDYVRYVEDTISRRLLSDLEADGGMRPALQQLDAILLEHRAANLLSPVAEVGDSRAAIHGLMHSMEWRAGVVALPPHPAGETSLAKAQWIRKHLRFGMVLRDPGGTDWLNLTQACDLAQTKESEFNTSTVLFVRGQRTLPAVALNGKYYVPMSAMMAQSENHVLTWNLRDVRTESILSFGTTYGDGWQMVGELRPDVAQNIAAQYGARAARVGLPVTLSAWRLGGVVTRLEDLRGAAADAPVDGLQLVGHAIQRPKAKQHELHLDLSSVGDLLTAHGDALGADVVRLLTGLTIKPGSKADIGGRVVCMYSAASPTAAEARKMFDARVLADVRNNDKFVVLLWSAS